MRCCAHTQKSNNFPPNLPLTFCSIVPISCSAFDSLNLYSLICLLASPVQRDTHEGEQGNSPNFRCWQRNTATTYSASRSSEDLFHFPSSPHPCTHCPSLNVSASPPPADSSTSLSEPAVRPSLLPISLASHLKSRSENVLSARPLLSGDVEVGSLFCSNCETLRLFVQFVHIYS